MNNPLMLNGHRLESKRQNFKEVVLDSQFEESYLLKREVS